MAWIQELDGSRPEADRMNSEPDAGVGLPAREWAPLPGGDDRRETMHALLEAARSVHDSLDLRQTLATIAHGVTTASGFAVSAVNMLQPDGSFQTVAVEGDEEIRSTLMGSAGTAEQWDDLIARSHRWGELMFIHHGDPVAFDENMPSWRPDIEEADDPNRWHPDDMLFAPLMEGTGRLIGMLSVDLPVNGLLPTESQCETLTLFAHHAGTAIEHALIYEELSWKTDQLRWAATHDQLTGLSNRRVLYEEVPRLAAVPDQELAMMVIDLDGFKQLNDTAGHHAGDQLLTVLAARMQACTRDGDLLARTGGDEFVVVIMAPGARATAEELAQRLKDTIAQPVQIGETSWQVSASIGIAVEATPTDHQRLLAAADAAMYRAKQSRSRHPGIDG